MNQLATKLELHYFLSGSSHSIDAEIRNRCETELINIIKEVSLLLNISIEIETEAYYEGGLKEIWSLIGENNNQITIILLILTLLFSRIPATNKELENLKEEETRLIIQEKKLNIEKLRNELEKIKETNQKINVKKAVVDFDSQITIIKYKSDFYSQLLKSKKITKIGIRRIDEKHEQIGIEELVESKDFSKYILKFNILPSETDCPDIISSLRAKLHKRITDETFYVNKGFNAEESVFFPNKLYDGILKDIMQWIELNYHKDLGYASIALYFPELNIYKVDAIYKYNEQIRNIVYILHEQSITTQCAKSNSTIVIPRRSNCAFASQSRNNIYKMTIRGEDSTYMAIPLNSLNDQMPFAIISFSRSRLNIDSEYSKSDQKLVLNISKVIEDSLRKAQLAVISNNERVLSQFFSWLDTITPECNHENIVDKLADIASKCFDSLGLNKSRGEALAIFLPVPQEKYKYAICLAERGFGDRKKELMRYELNSQEGLTGWIIDNRKYDFCYNHLSSNSISMQNQRTSSKCKKSDLDVVDHCLSFVGVPLGDYNENNSSFPYNKGALVINVSTPATHHLDDNFIIKNYLEPLQMVAKFMNHIIDGAWRRYCENYEKNIRDN